MKTNTLFCKSYHTSPGICRPARSQKRVRRGGGQAIFSGLICLHFDCIKNCLAYMSFLRKTVENKISTFLRAPVMKRVSVRFWRKTENFLEILCYIIVKKFFWDIKGGNFLGSEIMVEDYSQVTKTASRPNITGRKGLKRKWHNRHVRVKLYCS